MPKKNPNQLNRGFLPGVTKDLDRRTTLRLWMRSKGWTFVRLAELWGCHWTFPGKCLDAESEELPADRRQWLIDNGFPEELLPPYWSDKQKKLHNKIRVQRRREARTRKRAQEFRERRRKEKARSGE